MKNPNHEPEDLIKLDLDKYGLTHLKDASIWSWTNDDIEKLINVYISENISPIVLGIEYTAENIRKLLNTSYCRRCGRCCLPNPLNPNHPGVMVYEEDLKLIAKYTDYSYKYLKKKAKFNIDPSLPHRRYLPLPCIFYEKKSCRIYNVRPLTCRSHPIHDVAGRIGVRINVECDYGKEIYMFLINNLKKREYGLSSSI